MASISVIVPVYRVEAYLHRCVDSILAQSYRDFALILVDDGSPDKSGQICDEYAARDKRIHVIHQKNGGLSAARNAGMDWVYANSDSQWLTFIDSDDYITENYLEKLYGAVLETGCSLSVCGFQRTEGEAISGGEGGQVQVLSAEEFYCGETEATTVAVCKLYHRSLLETLRYPVGKLHEDEFTTYQAVYAAGNVAALREKLYAYYCNPASITQVAWNPRRMHVLEALNQQIAFAKKNGYPRLEEKAVRQYLFSAYDQLNAVLAEASLKQYRNVLRREMRKALKLGRESGIIPMSWEKMWAYEAAYPMKPFWWLVGKLRK